MTTQKTFFKKASTPQGEYWHSSQSRNAISQRLKESVKPLWKEASIGGDPEQGFEQAFSSLAYSYIKDKAPRLLDYIVGFQLVDRNQDNTKAIGLFGFKVGKQWMYGPVFFLNGDLKGHELLHIKATDSFVPLKENWVNYLIARKPHELGKGTSLNLSQLGGRQPNLRAMSESPSTKYSGDSWYADVKPLIAAMRTKQANTLYPDRAGQLNFGNVVAAPLRAALANYAEKFDMSNFLTTFPLLKTAFDRLYTRYPSIKAGFDKFYGEDFFLKQAVKLKESQSLLKRANVKARSKPRIVKSDPNWSLVSPKRVKSAGAQILTSSDLDRVSALGVTLNDYALTDVERTRLMKEGMFIKDARSLEDVSVAYEEKPSLALTNPSKTGLYEVLQKDGTFEETLILVNPIAANGGESLCTLVDKSGKRSWKNVERTSIFIKSEDEAKDLASYVDALPATQDLKVDNTYVAVNGDGESICPFEVSREKGNGSFIVNWRTYRDSNKEYGYRDYGGGREHSYSNYDVPLHTNRRQGARLKVVNGEVYVPDTFKFVLVGSRPRPEDGPINSDMDGSFKESFKLGNLHDVQQLLMKATSVLTVKEGGVGVYIESKLGKQELTKKAALVSLVKDQGLREEQALAILKAASEKAPERETARFRIKYANPYGYGYLQPGPDAPDIPEYPTGTEDLGPYNSVNSVYPQEEELPVDGAQSGDYDLSGYDPFYEPDQRALSTAQQASNSGQKEVFDVSMVSGLLKTVRQDSLVDRYLGDLMKALDKLGRILFMFYWHQEEFKDRYGSQDLPELEDSIRNSFETLGDLILYLKEKTVGGGPGEMQGAGVGSGSGGEPDIDESSGN